VFYIYSDYVSKIDTFIETHISWTFILKTWSMLGALDLSMETLEKLVKQLASLSPGTEEKLRIIEMLARQGEMPFSKLREAMPELNRSTLYNYLDDLVKGGLLKKRIVHEPGKRPVSYYSVADFFIYLSPQCLLRIASGADTGFVNDKFYPTVKVKVVDSAGNESEYHPSILVRDLLDAGIRVEDALDAALYVAENLYEGITTDEIAELAAKRLAEKDKSLAERFLWFLHGPISVRRSNGSYENWDRAKLEKEIAKEWKGIEKTPRELALLSRHAERCIKRQSAQGAVDENYVRDVIKMVLRG